MHKSYIHSLSLVIVLVASSGGMVEPCAIAAPSKQLPAKVATAKSRPAAKSPPLVRAKGVKPDVARFDGGIIGGKGHTYHLVCPKGWQMDTKSGAVRGIPVIFTPLDAPGPDYPTVLYSQIMQRKGRSLDELVQGMVNMIKPGAALADDFVQPSIKLDESRQAIVRKLPEGADGNRELVAFIAEPDWLVLIILAADTDADVVQARPVFESLVQSYSFGVDKVKIEE